MCTLGEYFVTGEGGTVVPVSARAKTPHYCGNRRYSVLSEIIYVLVRKRKPVQAEKKQYT